MGPGTHCIYGVIKSDFGRFEIRREKKTIVSGGGCSEWRECYIYKVGGDKSRFVRINWTLGSEKPKKKKKKPQKHFSVASLPLIFISFLFLFRNMEANESDHRQVKC